MKSLNRRYRSSRHLAVIHYHWSLTAARAPHNTLKLSMTRIIRFAPHVLSAGRIANADLSNRSRWRPAFLLAVAAGKASTIALKKWLKIAISSRNQSFSHCGGQVQVSLRPFLAFFCGKASQSRDAGAWIGSAYEAPWDAYRCRNSVMVSKTILYIAAPYFVVGLIRWSASFS